MTDFWQFLLLGVGLAPAYVLLAHSMVLVYRGSGVVNFASPAFALLGTYAFSESVAAGLPTGPALAVGLAVGALSGGATYWLVMRFLLGAAQLTRVIATLGVQIVVLQALALHYEDTTQFPPRLFRDVPVHLFGATIGSYSLLVFGLTVTLTAGLGAVYRYTHFGLRTAAVAENRRAAAALGHSPLQVGLVNWTLGGVLAALAGILLTPTIGLSVTTLTLVLVPALAAALLGSFTSFWLALLGGLIVAIGESELTLYITEHSWGVGWPQAFGLLMIVAVLLFRGTSLPDRSFVAARLPAVGTGRVPVTLVLGSAIATAAVVAAIDDVGAGAVTVSATIGIIFLSIVVVTGYAGQISLAQLGMAGLGAFFAAKLANDFGLGFWTAMVLGVAIILPVGALVGLPAVRTRGVNLAIVTLGVGLIVQSVVIGNPWYTGAYTGLNVEPPSLFGWSLDNTFHPTRYAFLCIVFFALCALAIANLRRGRVGRHLIAVRANERAAASLGIDLAVVKLYAFCVAAGLAAVGGILLSFRTANVQLAGFDVITSMSLLGMIVIGGLGYISATPLAGLSVPFGVLAWVISLVLDSSAVNHWIAIIGGVGTVAVLLVDPDGIVPMNIKAAQADRSKLSRFQYLRPEIALPALVDALRAPLRRGAPPTAAPPGRPVADAARAGRSVRPKTLVVERLGVRFGGVVALADVSLEVRPGEIVGLIGPNGAGKTTLVDAVTGMTGRYTGRVLLDGRPLEGLSPTRRARLGIGRSFQSVELFEDLNIEDNLRVATDRPAAHNYVTDLLVPRTQELPSAAAAAVREFDLTADLAATPGELPFGRRRLVGIARAVAYEPSILLLDEPASGLDERESRELATLLRRLAEEWRFAILLIEHDMSVVLSVSDRVVALDFGRTIAEGAPEAVRRDPAVIAAYLGADAEEPAGTTVQTTLIQSR